MGPAGGVGRAFHASGQVLLAHRVELLQGSTEGVAGNVVRYACLVLVPDYHQHL